MSRPITIEGLRRVLEAMRAKADNVGNNAVYGAANAALAALPAEQATPSGCGCWYAAEEGVACEHEQPAASEPSSAVSQAGRGGAGMRLRVICRDVDFGAAINVGGPVYEGFRTFEVEGEVVEALAQWLDPERNGQPSHGFRCIVGCEIEKGVKR